MPLSLNRNYLYLDTLPFENKLLEEIARWIISELLKAKFDKYNNLFYLKGNSRLMHDNILIIENNYTLNYRHIFMRIGIDNVLKLYVRDNLTSPLTIPNDVGYSLFLEKVNSVKNFKSKVQDHNNLWYSIGNSSLRKFNETLIYIKKDKYRRYWQTKTLKSDNKRRYQPFDIDTSDNWNILYDSNPKVKILTDEITEIQKKPPKILSFLNMRELEKNIKSIDLIIEYHSLISELDTNKNISLNNFLNYYLFPDYLIPIDIKERKQKFSKALKLLNIDL